MLTVSQVSLARTEAYMVHGASTGFNMPNHHFMGNISNITSTDFAFPGPFYGIQFRLGGPGRQVHFHFRLNAEANECQLVATVISWLQKTAVNLFFSRTLRTMFVTFLCDAIT